MSNKPTQYRAYEYTGDSLVYSIIEVDEILEKKDKEIAELQAENAQLKKETEFMHSNCKWDAGEGCARLLGEKLAIIEENVKLKQKLENVQASMYADVVDANMEVRRLKRALYKACANWAMNARMVEIESEPWGENHESRLWAGVYDKCLKKAKEYK